MILSLVLLGVLEYLWLHNEFWNKYRDMEDKLNHVMFSTIREVEDSLIFSRLSGVSRVTTTRDSNAPVMMSVMIHATDSLRTVETCNGERLPDKTRFAFRSRHPMRGMLLEELSAKTTQGDTPALNFSRMVMQHLRAADSTGEYAGYRLLSWLEGDTMIREAVSRPQYDVLAGKKMALSNPQYKSDIFHELLPHFSFAFVLWVIVAAAFYYIWKNLRRQMQLNALRDEFVSNITHELKTPITTVGVALESLHMSNELNTHQSKRYLEICQGELRRLSLLVDRILHSSAPQIQYERIDMQQVLDDVMHHMKVQFDNRQAQVEVSYVGDSFAVQGDREHMQGVLYNLLDNALKYSAGPPDIRVRLSRDNGSVKVEVEDQGIGIDPAYHDKVFEKLYRVPRGNRHDVKGHGLGLSYVADVVARHGGSIRLDSQPGRGSVFSLTLPASHDTGLTSQADPALN